MTFGQSTRLFAAIIMAAIPIVAGGESRAYPLWDGKEAVADYARRVNLPAKKTVELGNGVSMEFVLIPAGEFIMGSPEPEEPGVTVGGALALWVGGGVLAFVLLMTMVVNSVRKGKLWFRLSWLVLFTATVGISVGGFFRVRVAEKQFQKYRAAFGEWYWLPENEKPAHEVTIAEPFYMGKYEVTQEQYAAFPKRESGAEKPRDLRGVTLPAYYVDWFRATEYCQEFNKTISDGNLTVKLPTEAQWEYACRAGTRTRFYSGDSDADLDAVATYGSRTKVAYIVGLKKANAFGLYDMHGNVWEWCRDNFSYYGASAKEVSPNDRVLRGGGWADRAEACRSAKRLKEYQGSSADSYGFRVVMELR